MCYLPLLLLLLQLTSPNANIQPNKPATTTNSMVSSELETLFKIMETISSDQPWRTAHPSPCQPGSSWPGLECKTGKDNHLHVTRLDFGTPPNPKCKPTSTFPSEIFSLPYLQSVFFYQCFTHNPTKLTFPPSILSTLQQLSFRANPALIGSIPGRISSIKTLQVLTFSQNKLSGSIPITISTLNSLVHLDLSYNSLSGSIPYSLGNLENLLGIDLSYNALSGFIPKSIGQLGLLQKLDLTSNLLVGQIPNSIQNLNSLLFIALSNNKVKGSIPSGIIKLLNLQYFIMDNNPMFIPLPSIFGLLPKLQELRLANSGYFGAIPLSFCQLMNLTTLSLDNNRLTGQIPDGFSSLSHIYHLNISRNFLEGEVPFNASFFKRLGRNLDLSGNPRLCLDPKEKGLGLRTDFNVNFCSAKQQFSSSSYPFCHTFGLFLVLFVLHLVLF